MGDKKKKKNALPIKDKKEQIRMSVSPLLCQTEILPFFFIPNSFTGREKKLTADSTFLYLITSEATHVFTCLLTIYIFS